MLGLGSDGQGMSQASLEEQLIVICLGWFLVIDLSSM